MNECINKAIYIHIFKREKKLANITQYIIKKLFVFTTLQINSSKRPCKKL